MPGPGPMLPPPGPPAKNMHSIVGCSNRDDLLLLMYNDFDHRELWVKVLETLWLGAGRLITEILTNVIASDFIIENGKRILINQCFSLVGKIQSSMLLSYLLTKNNESLQL